MPSVHLGTRAHAALETVAELCEQPLATRELLDEVDERIRRVVPADAAGWWTSDPESLLPSELWGFDVDDIRRELQTDHYDVLDRTGNSVAAVGGHAGGRRLRVLARSVGSSWGMACVARAADRPPFTEAETRFVSAAAAHVGEAIRTSLIRTTATTADGSAPGAGTLVLDEDHRYDGATRDAQHWLARLGVDASAPLPPSMRWAALQAQAREDLAATGRRVRPARVRMPLRDGTWLFVRADALTGGPRPRTALTLRPAGRAELLPLQFALHGITPREAEVSSMLIDGRTTDDIAATLQLSRHTVRDHVKATYAKLGVHSRPELTALLSGGARAA